MANIIAVIWDFDKTLINGYMEDPLLRDHNIDPKTFWDEVSALPKKYLDEQGVRVNPDTIYLNHMINYARNGTIKGLNNAKLRDYGKKMDFYKGVPEIFEETQKVIDSSYQDFDIKGL